MLQEAWAQSEARRGLLSNRIVTELIYSTSGVPALAIDL